MDFLDNIILESPDSPTSAGPIPPSQSALPQLEIVEEESRPISTIPSGNKKHPVRITNLAIRVLRVRLSFNETQEEFGKRFRVSKTTVYQWERGAVGGMQKMFAELLDSFYAKLMREGRLVSEEAAVVHLRQRVSRRGNAADYY